MGCHQSTPKWDVPTMKKGLKLMETAVEKAATCQLQPEQPLPPTPPPEAAFAGAAHAWTFDIFTVPFAELPKLAYTTLVMHPCVSGADSKLNLTKLWRFVVEIAAHYHDRPFHDFRHAVDVTLATSGLIRRVGQDHPESFTDATRVAALLISALVHDTDHPGVMNTFMVSAGHPVALRRGESKSAVLEHHHAKMALTLLDRPELDFLDGCSADERARFTGLIHENVSTARGHARAHTSHAHAHRRGHVRVHPRLSSWARARACR